jgi:hypothetical protein
VSVECRPMDLFRWDPLLVSTFRCASATACPFILHYTRILRHCVMWVACIGASQSRPYALPHEGVWGNGCAEPRILDLIASVTPISLSEGDPRCPMDRRRMDTDFYGRQRNSEKILPLPGLRPSYVAHTVASCCTD